MKALLKYITTAALLIFSFQSFAQNPETTRLGIGLSIGTGTNGTYGSVIGGDVRLQPASSSLMISIGYTKFSLKSGAPGLGIGSNAAGIDLSLRYEGYTSRVNNNPAQLAFRMAYGIKLSKKK
jgi:hypothetical protein